MSKRFRWGTFLALFLALFLVQTATGPLAGQDATTFDHALFDGLLGAHVDSRGLVDYDAFGGNPAFRSYLDGLAQARPESLPRQERMAEVAGRVWTLDEIEQEIIRKESQKPRIHFALVCAALGCPPLRNEAYTGEELDRQLDEQARIFLTREPEKNRVDTRTGTVHLSPIFDWYREDFPAGTPELGAFLADYFPPGLARDLLESGSFRIRFTEYDWSLNARGAS